MSEEGNATLLAGIIEEDPSLTSRILKVANSSFYCASAGKITSISLAITRIGFNEIGHIALAVHLVRQFSQKSNVRDYKTFWKHSLTAAYLCRKIGESQTQLFSENECHVLFLSGLLHDIGILVYDQFFHRQFEAIIAESLNKETSFLMAERAMAPNELHSDIGSVLLKLWKFDADIEAAVRFHHTHENAPEIYRDFVFVLYLTEYYLCSLSLGSFEGSMDAAEPEIPEGFSLTHGTVLELLRNAETEVEESNLVQALESGPSGPKFSAI
jgi:HD-like signal output (HDOD) protein